MNFWKPESGFTLQRLYGRHRFIHQLISQSFCSFVDLWGCPTRVSDCICGYDKPWPRACVCARLCLRFCCDRPAGGLRLVPDQLRPFSPELVWGLFSDRRVGFSTVISWPPPHRARGKHVTNLRRPVAVSGTEPNPCNWWSWSHINDHPPPPPITHKPPNRALARPVSVQVSVCM